MGDGYPSSDRPAADIAPPPPGPAPGGGRWRAEVDGRLGPGVHRAPMVPGGILGERELCRVCARYPAVPGTGMGLCRYHTPPAAFDATLPPGLGRVPAGRVAEPTLVIDDPPPPRRPNPSGPSGDGGRWFGRVLLALAVVAMAGAVLVTRAERAERDTVVAEGVADFASEACAP